MMNELRGYGIIPGTVTDPETPGFGFGSWTIHEWAALALILTAGITLIRFLREQ